MCESSDKGLGRYALKLPVSFSEEEWGLGRDLSILLNFIIVGIIPRRLIFVVKTVKSIAGWVGGKEKDSDIGTGSSPEEFSESGKIRARGVLP